MMKKLILLAMLTAFGTFARAQSENFHAFKFDIGFGYAIPSSGSGTKAGATFTLQPHYRVSDDLAVGLRIEGAGIGYENSQTGDVKVSILASYCATAEYYFMDEGFRPFVGAGVGLFIQAAGATNENTDSTVVTTSSNGFGGFPEVGFEAGHFRLALVYNAIGHSNSYMAAQAAKSAAFFINNMGCF